MKKQLYQALLDLYNDYKCLADSGDAGFWRPEDTDVGQKALEAIKAYEDNIWKDWSGGVCPVTCETWVTVENRLGGKELGQAYQFSWYHQDCYDDIIKYKIIKR